MWALVTGASSGIGRAFAARLAAEGYDLVTVARNRERLGAHARDLRRVHGCRVEPLAADLTTAAGLGRVEARLGRGPRVDLLVNNAGFGTDGVFWELDPDREEAEIRLNVVAVVRLTRAALPAMVRAGTGAIINVASLAAFVPDPLHATYGATKAFVVHFTESLAEAVRDRGVKVQALCPGFTRTEFQARAGIDVSQIPGVAWMDPDAVVAESLRALEGGRVICIPGAVNRAFALAVAGLPRSVLRRVSGAASRRLLGRAAPGRRPRASRPRASSSRRRAPRHRRRGSPR